jgi:hypothetical protein
MSSVVKRRIRRLVNFVAYVLPIYAAWWWYPRSMWDISSPPLGFYFTIGLAVVLVMIGMFLEE